MARSAKEAIFIIFDISQSASQEIYPDGSTFLEKARTCISRIIKRKIFSSPKDEIGMVLIGSEETANSLGYEHISEAFALTMPSWEMLSTVEKMIQGTSLKADWLDGVVVALDILREETQGKKFTSKKLVLFTNCGTPVNSDKLDEIVQGIQSLDVEFTAIGADNDMEIKQEYNDSMDVDGEDKTASDYKSGLLSFKKIKTEAQEDGEDILARIVQRTDGISCNFDDALSQLRFYQKPTVRPTPWNVCLDIGPNIKIPISGFKKISSLNLPSWKIVSSVEETTPIEKERTYFKTDKTPVDKDDVIDGYSFGSTLVAFNEFDKRVMSYKSGDKCLSVLGFTKSSNIPRHLMIGVGVYYFVPQRDKPEAIPAFSAFVLALKELDMVPVVRKIYNNNNAPTIGVLIPHVEDEYQWLVHVELPYSEDIREFVFPPLPSDSAKPTSEQFICIDALIDNSDLMNIDADFEEEKEALCPDSTPMPYRQHLCHSMAHRVCHPDDDLPPLSEDVKMMLKCPFESKDGYKEALEAFSKYFELKKVEPKQSSRKRKKEDDDLEPDPVDVVLMKDEPVDLSNMKIDALTTPSIIEVGTVKPEQDFHALLEKQAPLKEVCIQMQKVILNLVIGSFGSDNFSKAQSALKTLRITCAEKDPQIYNDWLPHFKSSILDRGKDAFWELIPSNQLGLISVEENPGSSVSVEESEKFLQDEKESTVENVVDDSLDADDLLNEM